MTNGEKATAALSYLDGLDTTSVINVLNPYLDDDELAGLYDQLVSDGLIEEPRQRLRLLLRVSQEDGCWGALAEKYNENYSINDVLELARKRYPEVLTEDWIEMEEMDGEIQDEEDGLILTWEDGIGEMMRIYEK